MPEEIIIYLLKVSLGLGIISLSYLLFRNDAGLRIKRFYLLFGVIACWVFPLLHFPQLVNFSTEGPVEVVTAPVNVRSAMVSPVSQGQEVEEASFNWLLFAAVIYVSGILFLLFRNIGLINRWWLRRKNCVVGDDNIVFTEEENVFTLFRWIFLPAKFRNDPSYDSIVLHEKAHVEQLHYIDLIIIELTLLFTWFNPFTWLISGMIKENHEHLADRKVLAGGVNPAHYRAQLLNLTLGITYFRLGHQFNHSLTKTRFKMMKKTVTKKTGILKYILVLPVIITALMIFTGSTVQDQDGSVKGKVYFSDSGDPAHGASVVIKGTRRGSVIDKNGEFALEYEGNPLIVISFVGYETVEMKASEIGKKPINLEVKSYKLNLGLSQEAAKGDAGSGLKADRQEEEVFIVVEDMPEFPGGMEALSSYIYDNLEYPEKAKRRGVEGEATIGFTVNTDGGIEDINIIDSSYEGFGKAAMKVFKDMPEWEPGKQRGMPVKVKLHVPVDFTLDRE